MTTRHATLQSLKENVFDVLIIGGGINGAVSAAALSARGIQVALIDKGDYASCTSQESSYLVWGGIKYMENYEFSLVRDLCVSRNHLMTHYPSTVKEVRFYCPHEKSFRHSLAKLYAGIWFYWTMGSGYTQAPRYLTRHRIAHEEPCIHPGIYDGGFEYSDAYLADCDARFVFGFVRAAKQRGASVCNYVKLVSAKRDDAGMWQAHVQDGNLETPAFTIRARCIINAAGPFADIVNAANAVRTRTHHVFSKGIHLIVPRIAATERVLTFVASDSRMFFVIPLGPASCIGTTDTRVETPTAVVTPDDRRFILDNINAKLNLDKPLTTEDILSERCGVRPLAIELGDSEPSRMDFLSLSRKHVIETDPKNQYLSIFGGKITDCINIGEEICQLVHSAGIKLKPATQIWFGEPGADEKQAFMERAARAGLDAWRSPDAWELPSERLWRRYQREAFTLLEQMEKNADHREIYKLGVEYFAAEISHMARSEDIITLEDFLRRRTIIALINRAQDLANSDTVRRMCALLFGPHATEKFEQFRKSKLSPAA